MTFALGPVSDAHLEGVHPELVRAVRYAIAATTVDFQVFEGLRSLERQKELVAKRVSRTMKSYHLTGDEVREYERRWRAEHPGGDSDPLIDYPHFQRVRA